MFWKSSFTKSIHNSKILERLFLFMHTLLKYHIFVDNVDEKGSYLFILYQIKANMNGKI